MTMKRRFFIGVVTCVLIIGLHDSEAQTGDTTYRIGLLFLNPAESGRDNVAAFQQGLQERGWIEGRNVRFESRYAAGRVDRLPSLAKELVQANVDVIVTSSSVTTRAAAGVTKTIPIVMAASADALREGLVTSLAHPGGNITGMTFLAGTEFVGKQLELLNDIAPTAHRVAVLTNPSNASHAAFAKDLRVAARTLGKELQMVEARYPDQLEGSFAAMLKGRAAALLVLTDSLFFGQRRSIVELAAASGLPAMYSQREFVDAGGLVSYGPNLPDMFRHAAAHVDKVLRGAKPADLPVEQPTKFELAINLRTAKALALPIAQSMLLRADQIIE
jgi:putative ABC transport system substrate-binding protein